MNIKEATQKWVGEFNAIPTRFISKVDTFYEVTPTEEDEYDYLPMWGTMWTFGDSADNYWLENEENLKTMADCGFRIYEEEDLGYVFGIDGAGYDFYEAHWIPLYKARGLQWHDSE